jgi:hypothetical protein
VISIGILYFPRQCPEAATRTDETRETDRERQKAFLEIDISCSS